MARRKTDLTEGGAKIERINALHEAMVEAAFKALENEIKVGEIKAATLNTIRQICSDSGVQPTRQQQEAMAKLYNSLESLDLSKLGKSYSY